MQPQFTIDPLPRWTRVLDWLLQPLMHIATATFYFRGRPQQTHRWHIQPVQSGVFKALDKNLMVVHDGDPTASRRHILGIPMAHLPILGGWKRCVVIRPVEHLGGWHIGWSTKEGVNIDRDQFGGAVRMLIGPDKVHFFGICAKTGDQIALERRGGGKIWCPRHRHLPLA